MKQLVSTHELAGNYTVVIDNCQDKVYLDRLDSQRPGIVMESNMSGNLWMDVSEMMSKYKIKTFPNVYAINDSTISSNIPYYTLDSVKYRARTIRVEDNKLRIFAPLILQTNESIPDIFIIYRKDLFCKDSKDEIVDIIDLHRNNISSYIRPKDYAYACINGNTMYINGIDVKDGQFVKADIYSDNILKDESDIEQLIYQSYKDRNMLYNNIINISFVVNDENIFVHNETVDDEFKGIDKTSAYLYWGRYANIEEAYPSICIEDYSGLEDDRSDIFIYTPIMNSDTTLHNTIEYVGDVSKMTFLPGSIDNALLKRQDGGYEQICFTDGVSNVKYNTNINNKYKYADIDRTTYVISSYKIMMPSMSFQYPTSTAYLNINIPLNDSFSKYVEASHNINISWVDANKNSSININKNAIDLNLSIESQISRVRSILTPYFDVHYSNEDNILTIVALNDKVLNINDITFTKSDGLHLVGVYEYVECKVEAKNRNSNNKKYKTIYKYSFPKQDTYVEISKSGNDLFLSHAKSKYIELNDSECSTRIHDKIHECFYDNGCYYIRTRNYKYGMSIEGNVLNLYDMSKSRLYNYTYIPVADVVDIRNIYGNKAIDINESSDTPIDIKTRVLWVDYSSIDKNGEYLVPAQIPTGSIDTSSSGISSDSWSYGQLMYNNVFDSNDPYFSSKHFQSKKMEDECIYELFKSGFDDDFQLKEGIDERDYICRFVHYVMRCCYKYDGDKYPILLYFKQIDYSNSIYKRFFDDNNKEYNYLKGCINNNDSAVIMDKLLANVGSIINNDISVDNITSIFESYLGTCSEDVLNDITVYNIPKIYNDKAIIILFGITYNVGIKYTDYKFKSIVIPCHRPSLKLTQNDKEYSNAFKIIKNEKAKQIILAAFIDLPCIMPFSLWSENNEDYYTMFGSFKRSDLVDIYNTDVKHDALDPEYIKEVAEYNNESVTEEDDKIIYKHCESSTISIQCIDYIDKDNFKKDGSKLFIDNRGDNTIFDIKDNILNQVVELITGNNNNNIGITQNTHFNLALVGYPQDTLSDNKTTLYPSKIHIYDNTLSRSLGSFFTLFNDFDNLPPQMKNILSTVNKKTTSIRYSDLQGYIKHGKEVIKCMLVPYNDVYNSYVRDLYNDNNGNLGGDYKYIAVNVQQYIPDKEPDTTFIYSNIRAKLKNASAYNFKNIVCSIDESLLNEYESSSNLNYFISATDSSNIKYAYCYPINGQIFTYDVVDDCVTLQPYNLMKDNDINYTGKLYRQFISIYNSSTNKIEHIESLENIFDNDALKVEWKNRDDDYHLNYRCQRFKSLVVYDDAWCNDEDTLVENVSSINNILSSKSYVIDNQWINYKVNRSAVDVKTYPSILYGLSLSPILLNICNAMMSNENVENSKYIDENECIDYADTFMFHLYDYYLKMHSVDDTDSFNILSYQPSSSSSIINYSTKLCYEQSYDDIELRNIFFTFNMKLRK